MVAFLYDVAGLSHQMMYEKMPDNDRRKNKCTSIYTLMRNMPPYTMC